MPGHCSMRADRVDSAVSVTALTSVRGSRSRDPTLEITRRAPSHTLCEAGHNEVMNRWPTPDKPGPGQESVWDYPRPPRLEEFAGSITVELGGRTIASTTRAWRVLETSHPPTYYLPGAAFADGVLRPADGASWCEWKGQATYYDLVTDAQRGAAGGVDLPSAQSWFRAAGGCDRRDGRGRGSLHGQRRGGGPAAGRLLRRLDHQLDCRPLQGDSRIHGLVTARYGPAVDSASIRRNAIAQTDR